MVIRRSVSVLSKLMVAYSSRIDAAMQLNNEEFADGWGGFSPARGC
ncbi:hypothetical protein GCM10011571_27570 [Marinithermofilum abyssi]|uniref:Uncharacterized protein n=1 Tax=Marinithermofilum abyssi TaxID=1571185 RepID=A0A8J2VD84_9BACL|nr:hypothetical protein [Marinithermofilum abyssi]GGE23959.1 hypothetical protein GCM10011571_27570 [Marinithermofilum abyssi]